MSKISKIKHIIPIFLTVEDVTGRSLGGAAHVATSSGIRNSGLVCCVCLFLKVFYFYFFTCSGFALDFVAENQQKPKWMHCL